MIAASAFERVELMSGGITQRSGQYQGIANTIVQLSSRWLDGLINNLRRQLVGSGRVDEGRLRNEMGATKLWGREITFSRYIRPVKAQFKPPKAQLAKINKYNKP
jgi:hypothetical protein